MANGINYKYTKDEDTFKKWLSEMPIFMVDYSTSNKKDFNKLANKYIKEYNESL